MIVTVSTVKDSLENIRRFVEGNLAGGVDHMVVFIDAPDRPVEMWLSEHPHVTSVVTDKSWWQGERPKLLNKRQRTNANLARAVLSLTDWAEWLFHIDADEIVQLDRAAVAAVDRTRPAIALAPLEVVSELEPPRRPTKFKRLLEEKDLQLLVTLGVLAEPTNSLYFRSHIAGKVGIRPCLDLWLRFHSATDQSGTRLRAVHGPGLEVLHYESYSGAEFVRKWTNMVTSGPAVHFGDHRMRLANALRTIVEKDLAPEVKEKYFTAIYREYMEDAVEILDDLDLLVDVDPGKGEHRPLPLEDTARESLRDHLEALRSVSKKQFLPEVASAQDVARTLGTITSGRSPRLHGATGWTPPPARNKVQRTLRRGLRRTAR